MAVNFCESKDVTNAWMNSPSHRANIVKDKYTEVGTGVATGMYQGRKTIFVAQVYANPIVVALKTVEQSKSEKTTLKKIVSLPESQPLPEAKIATVTKEEVTDILGAEVATVADPKSVESNSSVKTETQITKPTFWQRLLASPRNTLNLALFIVFGIITIAVLLNIFIKIKHQHPRLITNGLVVLAIVGAIFISNYYLTHHNMVITQSLDYSS